MNWSGIRHIHFMGIGGIGMSALARHARYEGKVVSGYDRYRSPLCAQLEKEGIEIHYTEIDPSTYAQPDLVVRTPAVPIRFPEMAHFMAGSTPVMKRAELLGLLSRHYRTLAVAGTHGKTTVSTMAAHFLHVANASPTAFLGGISLNLDSNYLHGQSDLCVTEADEFDRSFLKLHPNWSAITAIEADHLDIYSGQEDIDDAFRGFASQTSEALVVADHIAYPLDHADLYRYGTRADAHFRLGNFIPGPLSSQFDIYAAGKHWPKVKLKFPGNHNAHNFLAAFALCSLAGADTAAVYEAAATFKGVYRRMQTVFRSKETVYIDDYAHHPTEISALIEAVRLMYKGKITAVFQPHLYSRTRDFAEGFANSLCAADKVILLPLYPAREEPIEGISSTTILELMDHPHKQELDDSTLLDSLRQEEHDVLLTIGAGSIDRLVPQIKQILSSKYDEI